MFCYVSDILRVGSINADPPFLLTVSAKIPIVYDWDIDQLRDWAGARIVAFSSTATIADSLAIAAGGPVSGTVVASISRYKTDQLVAIQGDVISVIKFGGEIIYEIPLEEGLVG